MKSIPSIILAASILTVHTATAADAPKKATPAPAEKKAPAKTATTGGKKDAAADPKAPDSKAPAATVLPDPVAVVEGAPIKSAELQEAFDRMVKAQNIPLDELTPEQRMEGYRMILDDMIIEKIVDKRSATSKVTDEEVKARLEGLKARFGSEEAFQTQFAKTGMTMDKLMENIRDGLRQEHWIESQIAGKDTVTDADVEAFYKANQGQFTQPETVRASHILIRVEKDAKPEVVAEKEKAAKAIADRVKKGEPFDKLAKELSEDPSAKENSGDLNFFEREAMVPEFSDAAFKMKKDEISDPVRSNFGFHVIKVTDRKAAEVMTLESAKPKLMAYLQGEKKKEQVQKLIEGLREKADVKNNLPPAPPPSSRPPGLVPMPEEDAEEPAPAEAPATKPPAAKDPAAKPPTKK